MLALAKGAVPLLGELAGSGLRLAAASSSVREFSSQMALTNNAVRAGVSGRSSVSGVTATIFGANGFVGSYVTNEIAKMGSQVVVPYRSTDNDVQHLKQMGDLGQMVMLEKFDISDEDMVKYAISRSNVVINMIGQRKETMNFGFEDVHVRWPERLAKIVAQSPHVERFLHFSEIGVAVDHPSKRLASKAKGDALVREITPNATIVRPGPVVGIEDHFFNYMIYNLSFGLMAPVFEDGQAKIQPTWVVDVANAVPAMLKKAETKGQTVYLSGPETLTIRETYDVLIRTLRLHADDTIHVPKAIAKAILQPLDKVRRSLPLLPMDSPLNSVDFVEETTHDRVAPRGAMGYEALGMKASVVTDGLPLEPARHFRVGGYRWGDMATVAEHVPENIRKFYNIK